MATLSRGHFLYTLKLVGVRELRWVESIQRQTLM